VALRVGHVFLDVRSVLAIKREHNVCLQQHSWQSLVIFLCKIIVVINSRQAENGLDGISGLAHARYQRECVRSCSTVLNSLQQESDGSNASNWRSAQVVKHHGTNGQSTVLHWGRARSCQGWSFVCFVASGNSALVHGLARQLLGAMKQTKNRVRLLLATPQCRLAFKGSAWVFYCWCQ